MLGDTKERNYKLLLTFLYGMLRSAQECSGMLRSAQECTKCKRDSQDPLDRRGSAQVC